VHFNLPIKCNPSDEYFDLLPGEARRVFFSGEISKDFIIKPFSILKKGEVYGF
jgi:hypothetical protein